MLSQTAGTRRAFRLALCLLFWIASPGLAWASLTGLSGLDASRLPDLPSKLETAALQQREQPACTAFCARVLRLELEASILAGRVPDPWHPFGLRSRDERQNQASFATEWGSGIVNYANDNPTRYVDPTGHLGVDLSVAEEYSDRVLGATSAVASDFLPLDPPHEWKGANGSSSASAEGIEYGHKLATSLATTESFFGARAVVTGAGTAGAGTLALLVPGYGELYASRAYPWAVAQVVGGTVATVHGTWAMSRAQDHLSKMGRNTGTVVENTPSKGDPSLNKVESSSGRASANKLEPTPKNTSAPAPTVTRKIPSEKLKFKPKERGRAPIGEDGKPVELHHADQDLGNASPRVEKTRTDHRGKGNFVENHSNTGQQPSTVDRKESSRQHRAHWQKEWDSGRFADLPESGSKKK